MDDDRWVKERIQIVSIIEYLDSINDGSEEAIEMLNDVSLKLQVGANELELQLDRDAFDVVYNMLLELRRINTAKRKRG